MALNFHELYVLLEFWGGGGQGGEGRSNPRSLKGRDAHVFFDLVIVRERGKPK